MCALPRCVSIDANDNLLFGINLLGFGCVYFELGFRTMALGIPPHAQFLPLVHVLG